MNRILTQIQSFIHEVTTNDRYASYGSSYKNSPLTSATGSAGMTASEGLVSSTSGIDDEGFSPVGVVYNNNTSSVSVNSIDNNRAGSSDSRRSSTSARIQYTPGMRSNQVGNGGIAMQDYTEPGGAPPPSPVQSWKRIERWLDSNFPELFECMNDPATSADLNELETDLDCNLPIDVRDSYMIHDGQEEGGRPAGLFFGIYFLGLDEIATEWEVWKNTAIKINSQLRAARARDKRPDEGSSSTSPSPPVQKPTWLERQDCLPEGTIQKVYSHPAWIPLARDNEGNNIAVDLAPGPKGKWGQVIIFGREFDRKYVIAPSWAAFLALFADDLEANHYYIHEDLEEAEFWLCTPSGRPLRYLQALRGKVERQYRPRNTNHRRPAGSNGQLSAAASARKRDQVVRTPPPGSGKVISSSNNGSPSRLVSPIQSTASLPNAMDKLDITSSPLRQSTSAVDLTKTENGDTINGDTINTKIEDRIPRTKEDFSKDEGKILTDVVNTAKKQDLAKKVDDLAEVDI